MRLPLLSRRVCTQDDKWDEDIKPEVTFLSIYARSFTLGSALIGMPRSAERERYRFIVQMRIKFDYIYLYWLFSLRDWPMREIK